MRSSERAILAACGSLLLAAALVIVTRSDPGSLGAFAQEEGSLRAPPSDALFTDGFGAPGVPAPVAVNTPAGDAPPGNDEPGKDPEAPPAPGPPGVPPDDPDDGLLGFLPDLPVLPPLPPPPARPNWLPARVLSR